MIFVIWLCRVKRGTKGLLARELETWNAGEADQTPPKTSPLRVADASQNNLDHNSHSHARDVSSASHAPKLHVLTEVIILSTSSHKLWSYDVIVLGHK